MKKFSFLSAILVAFIFLLAGCRTATIQNVDNSSYFEDGKSLSMYKVEEAIKKGAIQRGWRTKKIHSGLIEAKNNVRGKHLVVVNITYDSKGYKIDYKHSENMKYDPKTNSIHANYNKWIFNLEKNINYELSNEMM